MRIDRAQFKQADADFKVDAKDCDSLATLCDLVIPSQAAAFPARSDASKAQDPAEVLCHDLDAKV
jgi:hypothetical protein